MLPRGDAGLLDRAAHRADAALLGGSHRLYRRAAAGRRGGVEGGVPAGRHVARRGGGGGAGAEPRQCAGTAHAGAGAVARPVPLRLVAGPHAAQLRIPARRLYREHHRLPQRRGARRDLHHRAVARGGDFARHRLRQPRAGADPAADGDAAIARPDRDDSRRRRAVDARRARRGGRRGARPRPAARGAGHQRGCTSFPSICRSIPRACRRACARCARSRINCR